MRRWAALCFVLSGLALAVGWTTRDLDHRLDGAPTAIATVLDVTNPVKAESYLDLELTLPDGQVVHTTTSDFLDVPKKGDEMQVEYAVDGKDLLVREVGVGSDRPGLGSLIAAGASAVIGLVLLILRTRGDQQSDAVKNPVQPER
ncbi:hypothetical protein ACIA49_21400 [Kribbella sp. NPDC051587]|uniref:hypothetical protein n=1 Tax=Kribbella sp. NPDC051587 TaxID=3364119 RepID=UPI0037B101AE